MSGLTTVYLILEENDAFAQPVVSVFASLSERKRDEVYDKIVNNKQKEFCYYYKDSILLGVEPTYTEVIK